MLIYKHSHYLNVYRFWIDLTIIAVCWILAFVLRFDLGLVPMPKGGDSLFNYARLMPVLLIVYALMFSSMGVYRRSLTHRRVWDENFDLLRVHALAFFVFVTTVYFLFEHRFSRVTLLIFAAMLPFLLPVGRSIVRKLNRAYLRKKRNQHPALIVGQGPHVARAQEMIRDRRDWNIRLVSVVPATDVKAISHYVQNENVEVVFVSLNREENAQVDRVLEAVGNSVAEVYLFLDFGTSTYLPPKFVTIEQSPVMALNASNLDGYGRFLKRAFDVLFSASFLLLSSPLLALIALAVKLTSKGPVLYRQERMGLDGRVFTCLKFRGMYSDAEKKTGPVWATSNDARVTPLGKWLRKTSLDELPQFWNVLKGEMSVVGPRPERPFFVQEFRHQIPGYMLRHKSKSGITGWAQINGWRGNTSLEKRIECDLWYLQNWSLWLDIKICLLTPFRGLIHPNAY